MSKVIAEDHQYGFNIEEDKKALYGSQVEELEEIRFSLWSRLNHSHKNFKVLKHIIQNPMPITVEQFKEWQSEKEEVCDPYIMSQEYEDLIDDLENFIIMFHVR